MISLAPGTKVFLACRPFDPRAGFNGLAAKAGMIKTSATGTSTGKQMLESAPSGGEGFERTNVAGASG
jgi:hypothetical protein